MFVGPMLLQPTKDAGCEEDLTQWGSQADISSATCEFCRKKVSSAKFKEEDCGMRQPIQRVKQSWSLVRRMRRNSVRVLLFLAIGGCALLGSRADATTVTLIGLDRIIAEAELIVEGKVVDVTSRWSENRTTIYTDVTLGDLNVVHGEVPRDTLTLRFEGGGIDSLRVEVLGAPSFDLGEREFLFVRANNVAASPVVGFYQGRFKVIDGEIHDNDGLPLLWGSGAILSSRSPVNRSS